MILLDIDGVVVDFCGGMKKYLTERGIYFDPKGVTDYAWKSELYGCKRSQIFEAMADVAFWEGLTMFPNADKAVALLKSVDDVMPYTHIPESRGQYVISLREKLLESLGLNPHVYCSEKPYMADADALFEDRLETAVEWMQQGYTGRVYINAHPYNELTEEATRLAYENGTYLKRVSNLYEGALDYCEYKKRH